LGNNTVAPSNKRLKPENQTSHNERAWECDQEIPRIKGTIKMGSEALLGFVYIHHVFVLTNKQLLLYIIVRTENTKTTISTHLHVICCSCCTLSKTTPSPTQMGIEVI
jgi:hypothetical protein